jgi:hypothetical protein
LNEVFLDIRLVNQKSNKYTDVSVLGCLGSSFPASSIRFLLEGTSLILKFKLDLYFLAAGFTLLVDQFEFSAQGEVMRMQHAKLLFSLCLIVLTLPVWSVISDYSFNSVTGTYAEMTSGTIHGTVLNDNEVFNDIPLGFDFNYNGTIYTAVSIAANGFIAMGATVVTATLPISTGTTNNVIVPFCRDIKSRDTGSLISELSGNAPNRVFTIQWHNYRRSPTTALNDTINFQIRLYETSNLITFNYGYMSLLTISTAASVQCGLRGAANTEFINRTTTLDWAATTPGTANNAFCSINATVYPPNGLVFNWTPPQAGTSPNPAQIVSPVNGAANVSLTANLIWASGGGSPTGYKVYLGTDNPPTNLVNGSLQAGTSFTPVSTYSFNTVYNWQIVPTNSFGDAVNCPIWSFTVMPDPTVYTFPYTQNWDSVTAPAITPAWTVINANADAFTWVAVTSTFQSAPNSLRCAFNSSSAIAMDDWIVSPPLVLTGGTTYRILFYYKAQSATNPEKLEIKYGNGNIVAALTTQIFLNNNITNTAYTSGEALMTPATDGTYYFGFHGFSNANMYYLFLDSVTVSEYVPTFNPPQNLAAITGNGAVNLTWLAPATRGLTGYHVFRDGVQLTTSLVTDLAYMDDTVVVNTPYTYTVKAFYANPNGISIPSNLVNITPVFNPPLNLAAANTATSVVLTWQAPVGALQSGFKVYRDGSALTPTPITALTYTDTLAPVGFVHEYYITAIYTNPAGESAASATASGEPLAPPTNLTANLSNPSIILHWNSPLVPGRARAESHPTRDLLGFKLFRNTALLITLDNPETVSYTDANLEPGTYSYTVSAFYTFGESSAAGPAGATVTAAFFPPTNLTATGSLTNIQLVWHRPSPLETNLSGYRVFRDGIAQGHGLLSDTTYTDTSFINNVAYSYYVVAVYINPDGTSIPSNTVTATGGEALTPVTDLQYSVSQDSVFLAWNAPGRPLLSYKVYRDGVPLANITNPALTTYIDSGLPNGSFTYYVTAFYTLGESAPCAPVTATVNVTLNPDDLLPVTETALLGNYPNPFQANTCISYNLKADGPASLEIYNLKGQKVKTLAGGTTKSGRHSLTWNGTDDSGKAIPGGVYFCRMRAGDYSSSRKLLLFR